MTQNSVPGTQSSSLHLGLLAADLTHRHGWASYCGDLIEALRALDVRMTVVTARNSPPLEHDGVSVLPILPSVSPHDSGMLVKQIGALPQVRAALRSCDLVHSLIEPYAPLGALVAGRRPLLVTGHGSYMLSSQRRFPVGALYAWAFRRALLVCVSHYTARVAERAVPGLRTVVVNNGVDYQRFAELRHIGGAGVLSVGAVKGRKGTLELVRALARVPGVHATIVGSLEAESDYVAQVQAEIARLNLQGRVVLAGRVPEAALLQHYAEADLFALPSMNIGGKFEGYGLSLLEASAAGLPVIGTTECGAEDAVEDGVTGLLVPQHEVEQPLADAIKRLLSDRDLAARMGAAGRARAHVQTWDRVAAQMLTLYKAAISG